MNFTGRIVKNKSFGINFEAIVDGRTIVCCVTTEALQDINPSFKEDEPKRQYLESRLKLYNIAKMKIEKNEFIDGQIRITTLDLRTNG